MLRGHAVTIEVAWHPHARRPLLVQAARARNETVGPRERDLIDDWRPRRGRGP